MGTSHETLIDSAFRFVQPHFRNTARISELEAFAHLCRALRSCLRRSFNLPFTHRSPQRDLRLNLTVLCLVFNAEYSSVLSVGNTKSNDISWCIHPRRRSITRIGAMNPIVCFGIELFSQAGYFELGNLCNMTYEGIYPIKLAAYLQQPGAQCHEHWQLSSPLLPANMTFGCSIARCIHSVSYSKMLSILFFRPATEFSCRN